MNTPALCKNRSRGISIARFLPLVLLLSCGAQHEDTDTNDDTSMGESENGGAPPLVRTPDQAKNTSYAWELPPGFPTPWEPANNLTTSEKVNLGRHLFYDKRLSDNETQSCASCHRQELAFTDGLAVGIGSTEKPHSRSSMSLANVGYASTLTWGNPLLTHLERQALSPLFGEVPIELGLKNKEQITKRLAQEARYEDLFEKAFPDADQLYSLEQVTQALAAFERTLISGNSPYDKWAYQKDATALSDAAINGYKLFSSEKFECFHCHGGFNFTDHTHYRGKAFFEAPYHNTGLYNLENAGKYPDPNQGVYNISLDKNHTGQHKAPTLRNIALTAPYMHDGSISTLDEVLDHYENGGRTIEDGEFTGEGANSPHKDSLIRPIKMTKKERHDLIAFLKSLTDQEFVENQQFSNPWSNTSD